MSKPHLELTLLLAAVLAWGPAAARDSDREQPAHIEADRVDMDNQTGVSVYQGNVVFSQGSTRVSGDRITLRTENGEVQHLLIEGQPARYDEVSNGGKPVAASGLEIEFDAGASQLRIEGGAELNRPGEIFTGDRILYRTDSEVVSARGSAEPGDGGRVRIVIQPEDKAAE